MRAYIVCILMFYGFCLAAQQKRLTPCYFLKDTGTVANTEISNSVVELSDGTIYVIGSQENGPHGNDDIALLKYDACGNVLWIKYYGDTLANDGYYINRSSDERLLLVGQTATPQNGNDAFFYILDSSGTMLMQKSYGDSLSQKANYIEQTSDKGFVLGGYTSDAYGSNDGYVVKTDSLGAIQWQRTIGTPGAEYTDMVHELADGNYLISGDTKQFGASTDVELTKCDKNGNIIWDKTFGNHLENGCQGVYLLSNGNYMSYGETEVPNSTFFDFFIEMIDTAGNSISRHTFGGPGPDALFSLTEISGMDLICTGYSSSFNGHQAYDVVLFRVDTAGNMKWLKNIANPGVDIGYKLIPSLFGDYIITGLFAKDTNNNYFLTRTDTIANTNVDIQNSARQTIEIYPNPASEAVFIDLPPGETKYSVTLISITGEVIRQMFFSPGKDRFDIGGLANGAYSLLIGSKSRPMAVKKMFINH